MLKKCFISLYLCEAGKYIIILPVDVRKLQHKLSDILWLCKTVEEMRIGQQSLNPVAFATRWIVRSEVGMMLGFYIALELCCNELMEYVAN